MNLKHYKTAIKSIDMAIELDPLRDKFYNTYNRPFLAKRIHTVSKNLCKKIACGELNRANSYIANQHRN